MVVGRTIHVGFHSNFGAFKRNRHSKTVTRLAITNEFPFNPTYESLIDISNCGLDLYTTTIDVSIMSLHMIKYPCVLPLENPSDFSRCFRTQTEKGFS